MCLECGADISDRGTNAKYCLDCFREHRKAKDRKYYHKNKKRKQRYNKKWRERNKGYSTRWRRANLEKFEKARRRYRQKKSVREHERKCAREWYVKNRERRMQYDREYREENKTKRYSYHKKWVDLNRDKISVFNQKRRARKKNADGEFSARDYAALKKYYDRCVYCGKEGKLSVDHVMPLAKGGKHELSNMVLACRSCNSSKGGKTLEEWFSLYPERRKVFHEISGPVMIYNSDLGRKVPIYLPNLGFEPYAKRIGYKGNKHPF